MGTQNPQEVLLSLTKNQTTKQLVSGYQGANPLYLLGGGRFSPARYPMQVCYPRPDHETSPFAYHRIWHTGEPMDIPIRPMFGAYPYSYKIISSNQSGWSIGEFLTQDGSGDLVAGEDYGTLSNDSLVAGLHSIIVGVWDATGQYQRYAVNINVGNNGFFAAPTATGNGSGVDANNCMSFTNAYAASENLSPAKEKVLFLRGGNYSISGGFIVGTEKPRSIVGYRGEWPVLTSVTNGAQINLKSNDLMITGCVLKGWGNAAVFRTFNAYYERQSVWRCRIEDALGNPSVQGNEAGWFIDSTNDSTKRQHFFFSEIEFTNCHEVAGFDWYSVKGLVERHVWNTNKTTIEEPIWYPKASCEIDMRLLTFNNPIPTLDATVNGIIDIGNNELFSDATSHVRFCFVSSNANGVAIGVNTSSQASSTQNWIDHCTIVGGSFQARNYNQNDHVYVDRCVIQNAAAAVLNPEGNGATVTNLRAANNGLVDSNGRLALTSDVGLYGHVVRSEE